MKASDFDFQLPESLIAQHPEDKRDHSRLLVLNRSTGEIAHHHFYDIVSLLDSNDCLVINDTKVIPARLVGIKEDTKAVIEVLLLEEIKKNQFEALAKPAKRVKVGSVILFSNILKAICIEEKEEGIRVFSLEYDGILLERLEELGKMPLPPYIKEELKDNNRYQTVYATHTGSSAAPTAGLHFTNELLEKIIKKGVEIIRITLHVGLGTFKPVNVTEITSHHMHEEKYIISSEARDALNLAVTSKKRIIAVGTTSVRTLESNYDGKFHSGEYKTDIFIYPPYKFKVVDAIITNFHLPKSTLLMLISAFSKREIILNAYLEAIKEEYRFFSFGDSMFIS